MGTITVTATIATTLQSAAAAALTQAGIPQQAGTPTPLMPASVIAAKGDVTALGSPMQAGATVKATDTSGAALATHSDVTGGTAAILAAIGEITVSLSLTDIANLASAIATAIEATGGALSEDQTNWLHLLAARFCGSDGKVVLVIPTTGSGTLTVYASDNSTVLFSLPMTVNATTQTAGPAA